MKWLKITAAGNSFLIADTLKNTKISNRKNTAIQLCNQYPNAKIDGLIVLDLTVGYDFIWDFYNRDGSSAEMCGNAARCVYLYFQKIVKPKERINFLSKAGEVTVEKTKDHRISVNMPLITNIKREGKAFFVNTGVPHVVIDSVANTEDVAAFRSRPEPNGSNVTFLQGTQAVTFERGVEDYTLACGTGAVAAAVRLYCEFGNQKSLIKMPGGNLEVQISNLQNSPKLIGSASLDFILDT